MEGSIEKYVIVLEQQGMYLPEPSIIAIHMSSRVGHVRGW